MSKPSVIAKLTAKPGQRDQIVAAFDKMLTAVAAESGTEAYTINLDRADENTVWIFELYTDDDALTSHSGSDAMGALITDIGSILDGAPLLVTADYHAGKGLAP